MTKSKTFKIICALMSLLMIMGAMPISASASTVDLAETGYSYNTLYFENSENWSTVYAHYWNPSTDTTTWPGVPCTLVSGNIWCVSVPTDYTYVIFNDYYGDNYYKQTDDLIIPGTNYIATLTGDVVLGTYDYVLEATWSPYSYDSTTSADYWEEDTTAPSEPDATADEWVWGTSFESPHNYSNYFDKTWGIYRSGAESISITFSSSTITESYYDRIYIYSGSTLYNYYSGTELSGKTITVPGSIAKVRLTSDGSSTYYGFRVTNIVANYPEIETTVGYDPIETTSADYWEEDTTAPSEPDATADEWVWGTSFESPHDYPNYYDKTWGIHRSGAESISITFSSSTRTESSYDKIYIYSGSTLYNYYSGTELSGKTITVPGSIAKVRLTSDGSSTYYGFSVTNITACYPEIETTVGYDPIETTSADYWEEDTTAPWEPNATADEWVWGTSFESPHDYPNYYDKTWGIYRSGAESISLSFSYYTETESSYDKIYIYSGSTLYNYYSGTELSGKTITVPGSIVKVRLTSDGSYSYYGFTVTNIVANYPEISTDPVETTFEINTTPVYTISTLFVKLPAEWSGYETVYCHIYDEYGNHLTNWQSRKERCTHYSDDIYFYNIATAGQLTNGVTYYAVISTDNLIQSMPVVVPYAYTSDAIELVTDYYNSDIVIPTMITSAEITTVAIDMSDEYVYGSYFESPHNYPNNYDKTWIIERPGAEGIYLFFSDLTETESYYDYIYIYSDNSQLMRYSGTELAGQSVYVPGDVVMVNLVSDTSETYYGFSADILEIYPTTATPVVPDETTVVPDVPTAPLDPLNVSLSVTINPKLNSYTLQATASGGYGNYRYQFAGDMPGGNWYDFTSSYQSSARYTGYYSSNNGYATFDCTVYDGTNYAYDSKTVYISVSTEPTDITEPPAPDVPEIPVTVPTNNSTAQPGPTFTYNTNRYYFYQPEEWINEYTDSVGIYWWEGTGACPAWPGYLAIATDIEGIYYYDVPKDVTTIIWNNGIDGGTEIEDDIYTAAYQTQNIGSEYYDPDESPFYPFGTANFDEMIYVIDESKTTVSDYSGKSTFKGDWFYYYGNGKYGTTSFKGDTYYNSRTYYEMPTFITDTEVPNEETTGEAIENTTGAIMDETTTAPSAKPTNEVILYFEVPEQWNNYYSVYCHIWEYGGDSLANWQAKKERCTQENGRLYSYNTSKVGGLEEGKTYCVIFSVDIGLQTYDVLMTTDCNGDTLYCDGTIYENPYDRNKTSTAAFWKNQDKTMLGPVKQISSTGNVIGECYPPEVTAESLFTDFINYNLEQARTYSGKDDLDLIGDIISELGLDAETAKALIDESGIEVNWSTSVETDLILGDADLDGSVKIKDVTSIQKYAASIITLTEDALAGADVNADQKVNIKDATAIQKHLANLETGLEIGANIVTDGGASGEYPNSKTRLYFELPGSWTDYGQVYCHIYDKEGNTLSDYLSDTEICAHYQYNEFYFDTTRVDGLKEGVTYYVAISSSAGYEAEHIKLADGMPDTLLELITIRVPEKVEPEETPDTNYPVDDPYEEPETEPEYSENDYFDALAQWISANGSLTSGGAYKVTLKNSGSDRIEASYVNNTEERINFHRVYTSGSYEKSALFSIYPDNSQKVFYSFVHEIGYNCSGDIGKSFSGSNTYLPCDNFFNLSALSDTSAKSDAISYLDLALKNIDLSLSSNDAPANLYELGFVNYD